MNFKKWNQIISNSEYLEVCQNIQEGVCEQWNEEDFSVGIYSVDKISNRLVKEINADYEGCIVKKWKEDTITIEVDEKYLVTIKLQNTDYDFWSWEIVDFQKSYKYKKFYSDSIKVIDNNF